MSELEEKVAKLPGWAREYIKRLKMLPETTVAECARLRQRVAYLEDQIKKLRGRTEAMEQILTCAARGGDETAKAYVDRMISEYHEPEPEGGT